VSALVNDADAVVAAFAGAELDEPAAAAVALLALVAGQDVEPAEGSDGTGGRWQIARKVAEDRVISTVDPEARHTRKSPRACRDGYRAHLAADPDTGIITDEKLTMACGEQNTDPAVAAEFLAAEAGADGGAGPGPASGGDDVPRWYGDSAYGTGELRAAITAAGHHAVIKPMPLRPAMPGGLTLDDFTVDEQAGTVTCPAGVTRAITPRRHVIFGAACAGCPLRPRCTASKAGRTIALHPRDRLLRAARAAWPALRQDYQAHRPHIERTVAHVATRRGRRIRLRYRGVTRNNAWLKNRTAAINLRTLLKNSLEHRNGTWILAT
jgi:hypothetical protein